MEQVPFIYQYCGSRPINDFSKWELPTVGENHWKTASLKRLQESKRSKSSSSGDEAECRISQEIFIVPFIIFFIVLLAPFIHHISPVLAVFTSGDHDDICPIVEMMETIPCVASNAVHVSFALKREEMFVGYWKFQRFHKPRSSAFGGVMFVKEWKGNVKSLPVVLM